jgi:hypothetical protein
VFIPASSSEPVLVSLHKRVLFDLRSNSNQRPFGVKLRQTYAATSKTKKPEVKPNPAFEIFILRNQTNSIELSITGY